MENSQEVKLPYLVCDNLHTNYMGVWKAKVIEYNGVTSLSIRQWYRNKDGSGAEVGEWLPSKMGFNLDKDALVRLAESLANLMGNDELFDMIGKDKNKERKEAASKAAFTKVDELEQKIAESQKSQQQMMAMMARLMEQMGVKAEA